MVMKYKAMTWIITGGLLAALMALDAWLYNHARKKYSVK